jgi:hypothetical protein
MPMNLNDSPKYGQLSGADLEILGAREQAATARALRTAYKPTQGQMVGGWYVKPTWSQNLADAMMQYNIYKDEKDARNEYKTLIGEKKQDMADITARTLKAMGTQTPARQDVVPPVQSAPTNQMAGDFFDSMANGPANSTPTNFSPTERAMASNAPMAEAYTAPTAEATGNINAGATNNQFVGNPPDQTALANAVRTPAPLPPVESGQPLPQGELASADGTLPAVTVTPEPEPSQFAQMLRGEGQYAPIQKATVRDIPAQDSYNEAAMIEAATRASARFPELSKSLFDVVKERRVNAAAMAGHGKGVAVEGQLLNPLTGEPIGTRQPKQPAAANLGTDLARFNPDTNQWEVNKPVVESKVRIAKEGKTDITTNVSAAVEKSALIESNKNFIDKSYRPAQDTDKANKLVLNRLSALESLPINEKTGWGAEAQAKAAEVLVGMGYKGEEAKQLASNSQTFRAIQARQVNDELNMAKGPQTEGDAVRAKSTFASLGNTPQANQFINDLQRAVIGQRSAEAKFYRDNYAKALRSGDLSSMERDWLDSPEANRSIFDSPAMAKWNKAAPTANPTATYSDSAEEARYQAYKAANPKGK